MAKNGGDKMALYGHLSGTCVCELTILGLLKGRKKMRSEYLLSEEARHVLAALTPPNRLACEIALCTGLRINDVLSLKREQLTKQRFTVQEQKTGKNKRVYIPEALRRRALAQGGDVYIFPSRLSGKQHRSRQAVYKDVKRAAKAFRVDVNFTPHSLRKVYAVEQMHKSCGDIAAVQKLLNHSDPSVTMIYAMADELTKRKQRGSMKRKERGDAAARKDSRI